MMNEYSYNAVNKAGLIIKGNIKADNEAQVLQSLLSQNLSPQRISKVKKKKHLFKIRRDDGKLSQKELLFIFQRLSSLLQSDIKIVDALNLIKLQGQNTNVSDVIGHISDDVRAGETFSEALSKNIQSLPMIVMPIIQAGEEMGDLAKQLNYLTALLERDAKIKRDLLVELLYPICLGIFVIFTILFLSFFVIPQFAVIFEGAATQPPLETRIIMTGANFIRQNILIFPFTVVLLFMLTKFIQVQLPVFATQISRSLPYWGKIKSQLDQARFCENMGSMLQSGMLLSRALPIAKNLVTSPIDQHKLDSVETDIRAGISLSKTFHENKYLTNELIAIVRLGENTGELPEMLIKSAEQMNIDTMHRLKTVTIIAAPVMTAIIGLITALVIAAIMTGVLSLNETII